MPLHLDIKPKSPDEEPEEEPGDFELEFEPEIKKPEEPKPIPKIEKPQPVQKKPEPRAVEGIQKKPPPETSQVRSTYPHLEWEYQGLKIPEPKHWNFWLIIWYIFKFFLSIIVAFGVVFIATLFIVGDFYDPVPSALKAIKYAGIISGVVLVYIIYLFFKRKYLEASALLLGIILALGIFSIGYLYYKNDQTLPLLETLLSWFGL